MTILTPENAAFDPSGSGGSLQLTAQYELIETVNADFGPTADVLFNITDGIFMFSLFIQVISPAGVGLLQVDLQQPGGAGVFATCNLDVSFFPSGPGYDSANIGLLSALGGQVTVNRTLSGLAAGPVTYRITAAAYKLC